MYKIITEYEIEYFENLYPDRTNTCPYDKSLCLRKELRKQKWKKHISDIAIKQQNIMFFTSEDMFDMCPYQKPEMCNRYVYWKNNGKIR